MKTLFLVVLFAVIGLITSLGTYYVAKSQIKSRCEAHEYLAKDYYPDAINRKYVLPVMMLIAVLINVLSVFVFKNIYDMIYLAVLVPFLLDIGVVDLCIRRIPNISLLAILISRIVYIVVICIWFDGSVKVELINSIFGIVFGVLIFIIPRFISLYMGAGDTKFSGVIGFALGLSGYLETMIISGVLMLLLLVVLKATKKGNAKTKSPMGPAYALGFVVSLLFPLTIIDVSSLLS